MKLPIVTFGRGAWRDIVAAVTRNPASETYGYLIGRHTRHGVRVHAGMVERNTTTDENNIWLADADYAAATQRIVRDYAPLELVGTWHSHVYQEPCVAALLPLLSDADELTTAIGAVEFIVAVIPRPDSSDLRAQLSRSTDVSLIRASDGHVCRAEAWIRQAERKIVPCRVGLR